MSFQSLGLRSELVALKGLCEVVHQKRHSVLRTPAEPDYWSGNVIVVRDSIGDPVADVSMFGMAFPDANHARVTWDVPGLAVVPIRSEIGTYGYDVDIVEVLALDGPLRAAIAPAGIVLRTLKTDADWAALLDLQRVVSAIEEGYDPNLHTPFQTKRNEARRWQVAEGFGAWFGAFDCNQLVGTMGIFIGDGIARYQAVETIPSHRKRGICSALLTYAHNWAMSRQPDAQLVILADENGDGGRLYRRMGFALAETIVEANKSGY